MSGSTIIPYVQVQVAVHVQDQATWILMSPPINVLLINGPNLNLLGTREPHIYGCETLQNVVDNAEKIAKEQGAVFAAFQSNHEGAIVDRIHQGKKDGVDGIVINPGTFMCWRLVLCPRAHLHNRSLYAHLRRNSRCSLGCWNTFHRGACL